MTDVDAAFEQEFLHVALGDGQTVVEVDGVADDQLGETVAFRAFRGVTHPTSLPDLK